MYIKNVGFSFESQQNIFEKHFEKCTHFVDLKNIRLSGGTLETQCVMNWIFSRAQSEEIETSESQVELSDEEVDEPAEVEEEDEGRNILEPQVLVAYCGKKGNFFHGLETFSPITDQS